LGVSAVLDQVVQADIVRLYLDTIVEPKFYDDFYAYRSGKDKDRLLLRWNYEQLLLI